MRGVGGLTDNILPGLFIAFKESHRHSVVYEKKGQNGDLICKAICPEQWPTSSLYSIKQAKFQYYLGFVNQTGQYASRRIYSHEIYIRCPNDGDQDAVKCEQLARK